MWNINKACDFRITQPLAVLALLLLTTALGAFLSACGQCDDLGCSPLEIIIDSKAIPEGGSFEVHAYDEIALDCDSEGVECLSDEFRAYILPEYKPKEITVRVLDASGDEVNAYTKKPNYGVWEQNACADCPGADPVYIP